MNTIYRLVWHRILGVFVVASELAHRARVGRQSSPPIGHFSRRRLYAALALAGVVFAANAQNVTLGVYDPQINDQLVGATNVPSGATITLIGPQRFITGDDGTRQTTLSALQANGRIVSGLQWIGAPRLYVGAQSYGVTIPDPITGGKRVTSTYATANLVDLAPTSLTTTVPDVVEVHGAQYINARVGTVVGGQMNVNIGTAGALSTAATNGWTMAAKQSTLFLADGTGGSASGIDWQSTNRVTFTGAASNPTLPQNYNTTYVSTYGGAFNVTTLDGVTSAHTVNNAADLRAYNDFLIAQLQSGNLDPAQYNTEFNKAYSSATQQTIYTSTASDPNDEVAQAIGDRIVIRASGANATGTIDAGAKLEVVNSNNGAVRAEGGGTVVNNGTLATTHSSGDGIAMLLTGNSHGSNNGVINGNFFLAANGSTTDSPFGSNVVEVLAGSDFSNNSIINFATGSTNGAGHSSGIHLSTGAIGTNNGVVNVGVTGSKSNGQMDGVLVDDPTANFTNAAGGTIYIGRGPQTSLGAPGADVAINQQSLTTGINVTGNGTATNAGTITIGSKTQNTAAILVSGGANAHVVNSGTININGAAATVPRENIGISVLNSGSGGGISDTGTINLNGVNGTGIKIISTGATASSITSSGVINVAGGADPASGTRNFGVWVEGQGTATSTATIGGQINLLGDGAIGIHARGKSIVDVAASAIPMFASGSKQIAFFAYGPTAMINVASGTDLNVTTSGSDLFRLENGADFDGTGLTMIASGANSVAVLGTGAPSTLVETQDAHINVSGAGATGVIIEGGATGTIDAATTMQLTGVGAVAAIVDGQKHTLTGAASGSPVAATTLTTAATLSSATNGLTGYIARNSAKLTNTGDITFTGANATAIRVESGATATNSGNLAITDGGTGILVDSTGSTAATTANTTGSIAVNGGSVAARTRGVSATGSKAVVNLQAGSQVLLNGVGAIGAEAVNSGTVNVGTSATPVFANTDQIAFHAVGAGSKIVSAATTLNASTANSTIYRIDDGASLSLTGTPALTASGAGSRAIVGSGSGTAVNSVAAKLSVSGANAAAMEIRGGASGTFGSTSTVQLVAANTVGGIADGQKLDLAGNPLGAPVATTLTNGAAITGAGSGATGLIARNLGSVINNGSVNLTGAGAIGVLVQAGGTLSNSGTVHVSNGTGVRVDGAGNQTLSPGGSITADNGVAGVQLLNGAHLTLSGASTNITAGGSAHGILIDSGAAGLTASDATINVTGSGNGIENAAELGAIDLNNVTINVVDGAGIRTATALDPNSTVTFNVSGSGVGFAYRNTDGSPGSDDLAYGPGYVANVNGSGGSGIQALTTGNIDTQATVNVNSASGGVALLAGTAASTINSGSLTSLSTVAPVVDLSNGDGTRFSNSGSISASSVSAIAVQGSSGNDVVSLTDGAVRGEIATGAGSDQFNWTGGTLDGGLRMGNGANNVATLQGVDTASTYHLLAGTGGGNTLNFDSVEARGGSFAADDLDKGVNLGSGWNIINFSNSSAFTLTDDVHLANSDVNIDATSTLFAGDNVHPLIFGASAGSARVTNAGLIDLTNGAGSPGNTLTIDGDYVSQAGQLALVTNFNAGGALSNQFTDRLLVRGNVSEPGGATVLNITPSDVSDGELSDFNHNGAVDANEGISVVQVAGNSTAAAFRLRDGAVSAGPFEYGLYAFQPNAAQASQRVVGGSTTGDQFWDYRLANVYVCQTDCAPPSAINPPPNPAPGEPAPASLPPPDPAAPPLPPPPTPEVAAADACIVDGMDVCSPARPETTPQVPAYISAPTALAGYGYQMLDNLHRRLGEVRHESALNDDLGGEVFARYIGGDYHYNTDRSFQQFGYDFDEQVHALQVGANIFGIDTDKSSLRAGIAFTHGTLRVDPQAIDGHSETKFYSNSIAMMLTWQQTNGFYIDAVVSGDRHQGDVQVDGGVDVARIHATGWTASIETGYPWRFDNGIELEPQLQLSRQHLKVGDFTDPDGANVSYNDDDQNIGRLGLRLDRTWQNDSGRQSTPYLRLNYIQGWGGNRPQVTFTDDVSGISQVFTGGSYGRALELGLGGTMTFSQHISLYGEADYQKNLGDAGLRGWGLDLGARWVF